MAGRQQQPSQPQQQVTRQEPWAPAASFIQNTLFPAAQTAFAQTPRTPYAGDFYAGPTGAQTEGNSAGQNLARQLMSAPPNVGGQSIDFITQLMSGTRTPVQNQVAPPNYNLFQPGERDISDRFEAELAPLTRRFEEQIIPEFVNSLTGSGAYDNSRSNIIASQLFRDQLATPATETLARLTYEEQARQQDMLQQNSQLMAGLQQGDAARLSGENLNFANLLEQSLASQAGQQLAGAQVLPGLEQMNLQSQFLPIDLLSAYGAQEQGWGQAGLDAEIARWNEQLTAPWRGVNELASTIYGAPGGTSTTDYTYSNPNAGQGGFNLGGAVQGAVGVPLMLAAMGNPVTGIPMALLAALGGLGGGFG